MPKTQAQLMEAVRERLDEASAGEWLDKELRRWINKGCRDIARQTEVLQTTTDISIDAGDGTINGPSDTIRIERMEYIGDSSPFNIYSLEYRDFNAMDPIWWTQQATTQSIPQFWTTRGYVGTSTLKLQVYPVPPEDATLRIHYYKYPPELAISTTADQNTALTIPEGWDDAVEDYVEYMALRKDRDPRWQESKALYDEKVRDLRELSIRLTDQGGQIIPSGAHGGLPAWLTGGW